MRFARAFFRGFGHALRGIGRAALGRNFIVMLVIAAGVIGLGVAVGLTPLRWIAVVLSVGVVLAAEMLNSAIEHLADAVHSDPHPAIRDVKDIAAGAVLIVSSASAFVGLVVFWPYVF